jgi:predicted nucleic acid-binding protein
MPFVVDASIAAGWLLPDEASAIADALGQQLEDEEARVPDLFWHEARNLIVLACRRGRLTSDNLFLALNKLAKLPLRTMGPGDPIEVAQLALKHELTAYDAAYLALALCERRPLATLDRELRAAASAEGVTVLPGPL